MMISATLWLLSAFLVLLAFYLWKRFFYSDLPPGPYGVPLLGYLPFVRDAIPHLIFNDFAKKYGDIYSMKVGKRLLVILNSYETIRSAFTEQAEVFSGRPAMEVLREKELPGIFQAEGKIWQDYKRGSLGILKDVGFGKSNLEPIIIKEAQCVLKYLEENQMKPICMNGVLRASFSNVILSVLYNIRFEYDDERLQTLITSLSNFLERTVSLNMEFFIPKWLLRIPWVAKWSRYDSSTPYADEILDQLTELIQEKIDNLEENSDTTFDFVGAWLKHAENGVGKTPQSIDHLSHMVRSLFNPGTDTLATSLLWILLYLVENPQVQERMQKEMDDVVGPDRLPSLADLKDLPYVEATLLEGHRAASILPLSNRCNIRETTLRGYRIPNRTIIVPNIWAVHRDPETYPEPEKFRPERFLDESGIVKRPVKYMPFSIGRRQCLGASYSNMSIFLYMAVLIKRFTFIKPEGENLSFEDSKAMVNTPKLYRVIAVPR